MATKKASAKTAKKTNKASVTKKPATPGVIKKGAKYSCSVCGLIVSVDEICGCVETHKLICCSKSMKAKK